MDPLIGSFVRYLFHKLDKGEFLNINISRTKGDSKGNKGQSASFIGSIVSLENTTRGVGKQCSLNHTNNCQLMN